MTYVVYDHVDTANEMFKWCVAEIADAGAMRVIAIFERRDDATAFKHLMCMLSMYPHRK